jgi:anaerobic ribonucleoside-triphosphate reductase activating protein
LTSSRPEPRVTVARVVERTVAEGPGTRFAVWVQGCTIRCDGCFNPHLWNVRGGAPTDPRELAARAVSAQVEGVTLLGGEPFEQAGPLAAFAEAVRDSGLSVMTFTGHTLEDLRASTEPDIAALLTQTDLLVDGRYLADQPDLARPWVGSTNQRFHFLTDRYRHLGSTLADLPDRLEVRVAPDGTVAVNGWASVDQLDELLSPSVRTRGRRP